MRGPVMAVEIAVLALSGLLAVVQLGVFSVMANRELPQDWLVGPRDTPLPKPLSPLCGRLQRAFQNQLEGLVLYGVAAVSVVLGDASSGVTETAAIAYLAARVAYAPIYAMGTPWLRSAVWGVGLVATAVMLVAALVG